MDFIVLASLTVSIFFTAFGAFSRATRRSIFALALQAASIGLVELVYCLLDLITGLHMQALIHFLAAFAEWFTSAVISPLIIYWGIIKTENVLEKPLINSREGIVLIGLIAAAWFILGSWFTSLLPKALEILPFTGLMLLFSSFLLIFRRDPLKILVGLNMAENALYPLLVKSPISLVPFMLVLMIFVNIVGVFVVTEAYREYGTIIVSKWRSES